MISKSVPRVFFFVSMFLAFTSASPARAGNAIGIWLKDNGMVRMRLAPCGVALCGRIVWMREPRKDIYNPEQKDRARGLVGRRVVTGMVDGEKTGIWKGSFYNIDDGRSYTGTMNVQDDALIIQGCVAGGVICNSSSWTKVN